MKIINVGTESCRLELGHRGENDARQIVFNLSSLISTYGDGTAVLLAKRNGDTNPYPVAQTEQSGNTLTWTLNSVDTNNIGHGKAELFWYVNETLAKTIVYTTWTAPDIIGVATEAPDAYDEWVEKLAEYTAQIKAEGEAYVADSEAWAVGERDGQPVESTDETYENNSKFYAEKSADEADRASNEADRAEQAAATAGYMEIEIDENGHLIYTRTDAVDVDFSIDTDGHLIMEAI